MMKRWYLFVLVFVLVFLRIHIPTVGQTTLEYNPLPLGTRFNVSKTGGAGSGTVTNVATGCGLSGGPITATGTIITSSVVNAQTGTTYTLLDGDCDKFVTFSNASAIAVTAPDPAGAGFADGWKVNLINLGAGLVTITPGGGKTINGAATLTLATLQGVTLHSDNVNYFATIGRAWDIVCGAGLAACSVSGNIITLSVDTAVMLTQNTAQDATPWQLVPSGGSATAYTATPTPNRCASTQPATGSFWEFTPDVNSGSNPTLACGSQAALNIQELISGTATNIVSGRLKAGIPYTLKKLASTWLVVPQEAVPATATALAANGANCGAGEAAAGVNASGAAEGCFTPAAGSFNPTTTVMLYTDFEGGTGGSGNTSNIHFSTSATTTAYEGTAGTYLGAIKQTTAASANANALIYQDGIGGTPLIPQAYNGLTFDTRWRSKIGSTSQVSFCVGFNDQSDFDSNAATNAIAICYSTASSDTNYMCVTRSGGVATRTSIGVAADTSLHTFRIRATTAGTIKCSVDGTETAGQSTNVPSAALHIVANGRTLDTNAKDTWHDYFWLEVSGLSR